MIRDDTFLYYSQITNFDISLFFEEYVNFMDVNKEKVIGYYSGKYKTPDKNAFKGLNLLLDKCDICIRFFEQYKNNLGGVVYWNLLEQIEGMQHSLKSLENSPKYLRSKIYKGQFVLSKEQLLSMGYGNTIENLANKKLQDINFDNSWVNLSIYNKLKEEDYTLEGGVVLKSIFPITRNQPFLNSVLGSNLEEEDSGLSFLEYQQKQLYGIDLYKKFVFENDDLKILSPVDTIVQTIEILLGITKGSVPQYPELGFSVHLIVGGNIGSIAFPIIFRQISETFKTDDTISGVFLRYVKLEQDGLFMDLEIVTELNEKIPTSKTINLGIA